MLGLRTVRGERRGLSPWKTTLELWEGTGEVVASERGLSFSQCGTQDKGWDGMGWVQHPRVSKHRVVGWGCRGSLVHLPRRVPLRLSPYSHDRDSLSSSQDHIPLAALPLLATSSGSYQHAVGAVIARANQAYSAFLHSGEGAGFCGQVRGDLGEPLLSAPAWLCWEPLCPHVGLGGLCPLSPSAQVLAVHRWCCWGTAWVASWASMHSARAGQARGAAGAAAAVAAW